MTTDPPQSDPPQSDPLQSDRCADMLRALSEPLRLRIIDTLRTGPKNVGELATSLDVEVVTVSHHLGILRNAGLVRRERQGRFLVYRMHEDVFRPDTQGRAPDNLDFGCCRLEIPKG